MRKRLLYIPITQVEPGQQFIHYGIAYTRATEKEAKRHPSREIAKARGEELIFAYTREGERCPVSLVSTLKVNVEVSR
jgi:hypothetical protein